MAHSLHVPPSSDLEEKQSVSINRREGNDRLLEASPILELICALKYISLLHANLAISTMRRQVTATRKNFQGDITGLCNHVEPWSPRSKDDVIADIESGVHQYYVLWFDYKETDIHVVNGQYGKYLRTDRDDTLRNNLDDLPPC